MRGLIFAIPACVVLWLLAFWLMFATFEFYDHTRLHGWQGVFDAVKAHWDKPGCCDRVNERIGK